MNYVQHTRAAHERLRQQPGASPLHVSLYWALFYAWNAEFFDADGLSMEHEQLMEAARIGNKKTYRATLYDLTSWGLIAYTPSNSRHHASRCHLTNLSGAEVPQVKKPTEGKSAPGKNGLSGAEVPQALRAEVALINCLSGALLPQDSLLGKTVIKTDVQNVGGSTEKKRREVFSGEGLSGVEVIDDTPNHDGAGPSQATALKKKVAPKKKGVREATTGAAATTQANEPRRQRGRPQRPEVSFAESELATYEAFAEAFAGTDYALADLRFYHEKILNWRQKGEVPRRRDWKATATQFFLNDAHDNRLKLAPHVQRPDPGASPGQSVGGGIPATGYRSKRWD